MFTKRMSRRDALKWLGLSVTGVAIAACAPQTPTEAPKAAATEAPKVEPTKAEVATKAPEKKNYTIVFQAAGAAPTAPDAQLKEGELRKEGLGPAVKDYMDANPNIKVEYYYLPPAAKADEWLAARMMAQDCPDIFNSHMDVMMQHINKGWALVIDDYTNMPQKYMEGHPTWVDTFDLAGRITQVGPDGKRYGLNFDGAGVLIVYNKKIFADLGVTKLPVLWTDFMDIWDKCKSKNIIAFGGDLGGQCCYPHWSQGQLQGQLQYDTQLNFDDNKDSFVTAQELVKYTQLNKWPEWDIEMGFFKFMKQQAPFLPLGFQGEVDYRKMFRQGLIAMYMEGNWQVVPFKKDPPPFEYDWLFYPVITKDMFPSAPASPGKKVRLQGPWGSMNYFIPGYLPKTAPDKLPWIFDLLQWCSQPKYVSAVCAEQGTLPLIKGSTTIPEMAPFLLPYDRPVTYQSWAILSPTAYEGLRSLLGDYMAGSLTDDQVLTKAKERWALEVNKSLEENPTWKITS
jgi:ABC-type glycerol-3-phosphate transport system substrate-binding protein